MIYVQWQLIWWDTMLMFLIVSSVPLLKNLQVDKLAKIADVLEIVSGSSQSWSISALHQCIRHKQCYFMFYRSVWHILAIPTPPSLLKYWTNYEHQKDGCVLHRRKYCIRPLFGTKCKFGICFLILVLNSYIPFFLMFTISLCCDPCILSNNFFNYYYHDII